MIFPHALLRVVCCAVERVLLDGGHARSFTLEAGQTLWPDLVRLRDWFLQLQGLQPQQIDKEMAQLYRVGAAGQQGSRATGQQGMWACATTAQQHSANTGPALHTLHVQTWHSVDQPRQPVAGSLAHGTEVLRVLGAHAGPTWCTGNHMPQTDDMRSVTPPQTDMRSVTPPYVCVCQGLGLAIPFIHRQTSS